MKESRNKCIVALNTIYVGNSCFACPYIDLPYSRCWNLLWHTNQLLQWPIKNTEDNLCQHMGTTPHCETSVLTHDIIHCGLQSAPLNFTLQEKSGPNLQGSQKECNEARRIFLSIVNYGHWFHAGHNEKLFSSWNKSRSFNPCSLWLPLTSPPHLYTVPNRLSAALSTDWNMNPFMVRPHGFPHVLPKVLYLILT